MFLGVTRSLPLLGLGLTLVIGGSILGGLSRHRKMQRWLGLGSYMAGLILTALPLRLLVVIPAALGLLLFFHLRMPT